MSWAYGGYVVGISDIYHGRHNQKYDSWVFSKHGVTPQNGHCYRKRDDKPSNSLQQRNYLALKPLYSIEIPTWCHIGCYTHSHCIHTMPSLPWFPNYIPITPITPLYPQYNGRVLYHFSPSKKAVSSSVRHQVHWEMTDFSVTTQSTPQSTPGRMIASIGMASREFMVIESQRESRCNEIFVR